MTDFSRDLKGVALKITLSRTAAAALALLTIMPVAQSEPAQASWYFTGGSKKLSAYIDINSVKRVDDYAVVHELLNYEVEQFSEEGVPYLSALALTFFDCVKRQSSMFKLSLYTELWAKGKMLKEIDLKIPWMEPPVGSVVEGIMESVCEGVGIKGV
jgi:hypothetical protein